MPAGADTARALDTSVAVPLLQNRHDAHRLVVRWIAGRHVAIGGHALAETYSVLTRLPEGLRLSPSDAATLIANWFPRPRVLSPDAQQRSVARLSEAGVWGGAVYDGLVALAAREWKLTLATRDLRAKRTYERLGVTVEVVG